MHSITYLKIQNFRSCLSTELSINAFTPIVGYNNAGKSTILSAIEWLLAPTALGAGDFNVSGDPIVVEGKITGISESILGAMARNHAQAIRPYLADGSIRIRRRMMNPGSASTARLEVRDLQVAEEDADGSWHNNPTGLDGAIKAIFPSPIRIQAMEKAADDVGKSSKSNTIGKLIAAITEGVQRAHGDEFRRALQGIRARLSADGENRAEELRALDEEASAQLEDLFPGLSLRIDLTPPEIPDLFKTGTIQVIESEGPGCLRSFDSIGHGAQRCIQMALIRHLATRTSGGNSPRTTLLLIDEPELYLHPQGVEQVRLALKNLSQNRYQVVFSTHSPALITRDSAPDVVIVRKSGTPLSTNARNPLRAATLAAINEAAHQSRLLFELSLASEVFFSDKVLICEGKTEGRLLPVIFEALYGKSLRGNRLGLISLSGSGNIIPAMKVLKEMCIDAKAIADLDFAFKVALQAGFITPEDQDIADTRRLLCELSTREGAGFQLESDGFPKKGGILTAAHAWEVFATTAQGSLIAERLHESLLAHGIWVWTLGTIETALGEEQKGERAIQSLEQSLPDMDPETIRTQFPQIAALLDWFSGFSADNAPH